MPCIRIPSEIRAKLHFEIIFFLPKIKVHVSLSPSACPRQAIAKNLFSPVKKKKKKN